MGNILTDWFGVGRGATGGAERAAAEAEAARQRADAELEQQKRYQLPFAQGAGGIQAGMDPVMQAIMGWYQAKAGMPAGTQTTLPSYDNPEIPSWLVGGLSGPEGSWQKKAATLALVNLRQPGAQAHYTDLLKDLQTDVQRGTDPNVRLSQQGGVGWQQIPENYTLPNLQTGGGVLTTPGTTATGQTLGGGLPPWLTPGIDPALAAILRDIGNYKEPYTASELTTLMEPGELNAASLAKTMSNTLRMRYKQQGLGGSDIGNTAYSAPSAWLAGQRANMKAQGLLQVQARGDELKQQGIGQLGQLNTLQEGNKLQEMNNFGWLNSLLNAEQAKGIPYMDMSPYYNAAMNTATQKQNTSSQYAGQAAGEIAGAWGLLGKLGGLGGLGDIFGGGGGGGGTQQPAQSFQPVQPMPQITNPYGSSYYNYAG